MQTQKSVFISYRRTNIYMARAVYGNLRANGYDAFLDYQSLDSGDFSQSLLNQIAARAHFVVILTPSALERCTSPDDWMRKEIEHAIQQKRNVIPLMFEGFKFEEVNHYLVSDWLKMLPSFSGVNVHDDYFDEAMTRLCGNRYLDRDIDTVLHPVAPQAAQAAQAAQAKVDAEPAPTPEQFDAEKLFERAFRKYLSNDYDGAILDYSEAIRLNPIFATAYNSRGRTYAAKQEFERAIADYSEAIRLNPSERNYNDRGNAHDARNEIDLAILDYEAALHIDPTYEFAKKNLKRMQHVRRAMGKK